MANRWSFVCLLCWVTCFAGMIRTPDQVDIITKSNEETANHAQQSDHHICRETGCSCITKATTWSVINCTLAHYQVLEIDSTVIPKNAIEIFVTGGQSITIQSKAFDHLSLSILRIYGTRIVFIEKQAFYNIVNPSLLIQISNCDQLTIKTGAFLTLESSIESEISKCTTVSIEKLAFNRLHSAKFRDITRLKLQSYSFEFRNQAHVGKHGPVASIIFKNVTIPLIPRQVFFSSLAEASFIDCHINEIYGQAFSANQISLIQFINTNITDLQSFTMTEKTLILDLRIHRSNWNTIRSNAISSGIGNLSIEHSRIKEFDENAINGTALNVMLIGNEISIMQRNCLVINNWNSIQIEQNAIHQISTEFLVAPISTSTKQFTFADNEVFQVEVAAFRTLLPMPDNVVRFRNNYFQQICHCSLDDWFMFLLGASGTESTKLRLISASTFCRVNKLIASCFNLTTDIINVKNFTTLVCTPEGDNIVCEKYNGETKISNATRLLNNEDQHSRNNTTWIIIVIICLMLLLVSVIITAVIFLAKGSSWLYRKSYLRKFRHSNVANTTTTAILPEDDEEATNTITTEADTDHILPNNIDIPQELTLEFLHTLSKQLDNPDMHQRTCELIERLYEMFVIDEAYDNRQQPQQFDEMHLYEELGNLQYTVSASTTENQSRNILRLMEEKMHIKAVSNDTLADESVTACCIGNDAGQTCGPNLIEGYSEPSDAAVHLYSEVKDLKKIDSDSEKSNCADRNQECSAKYSSVEQKTVRCNSEIGLRPLPDKPSTSK